MSTKQPTPEPIPDTHLIKKRPAQPQRPDPAEYPFLLPPVENDEIGRLGNFRVLSLIGSGGMGMVFHAEDIALHRPVALKVMKPEIASKGVAGKRFLNEARAMAKLHHENLVTIFQAGQDSETPYFAMEFLKGENVESWVQRELDLPVAEILRIGKEIATGLAVIHDHGLIHRDIKPANLWLEEPRSLGSSATLDPNVGRRVKILDFGLVRTAEEDTNFTQSGMIVGTPAYLSPEQARGKKADFRSDLFSFGCVLYYMCTRRPPFEADNTMSQLASLVADDPVPVRNLNSQVPPALAKLIAEMLSKNPDTRPESAAEIARRLLQISDSSTLAEGVSAVPMRPIVAEPRSDRTEKVPKRKTAKSKAKKRSFWQRHGLALSILGLSSLVAITIVVTTLIALGPRPDHKKGELKKAPPGQEIAEADKTYLTSLTPSARSNYPFSELMRIAEDKKDKKGKGKKDFDNMEVSVAGVRSPHGIFMHAAMDKLGPVSISYKLDRQYKTFQARVGVNDSTPGGTSNPLQFEVLGDNKLLWQSSKLQTPEDVQDVNVSVTGVSVLKLQLSYPYPDIGAAHGAWFEPFLTK